MIDQRMAQRAPPRHGRKNRGAMRADSARACTIVKRFRKLAAALRKQQAGTVQRIGRLIERCDGLLQARLRARQRRRRLGTARRCASSCRARCGVEFIAGVENGERFDFFAADAPIVLGVALWRIAHSNPSNCARSLRVARKRNSSRFLPWCPGRLRWRAVSGLDNASSQKPCARAASAVRARWKFGGRFRVPSCGARDRTTLPVILLPVEEIAGQHLAIQVRRKLGRLVFRAAASAAQMIEADIGDDTVHPGIKAALEAETRQIFVNFQESFLINVASVFGLVQDVQGNAQDVAVVAVHELLQMLRGRRPARVRSVRARRAQPDCAA